LDDERKKIWKRITELEQKLTKKTSDYEVEAREAAGIAVESGESARADAQSIALILDEISLKSVQFNDANADFLDKYSIVQQSALATAEYDSQSKKFIEGIISQQARVDEIVSKAEELAKRGPVVEVQLTKLAEIFKKGDDYDSKLGTLHKSITERKKEIDELYYEVIGFTEKDDEGKETRIKGIKDELEESYDVLTNKMARTDTELKLLVDGTSKGAGELLENNQKRFKEMSEGWSTTYNNVLDRIDALLPRALTTGLSFAYSEKKVAEETESRKHRFSFNIAIGGLVAISVIPFLFSLVSIFRNEELNDVIMRIPRLVFAILPLYVPVLWVAYSSNRKMNLAKRLIEEYSHKEVLSKTFEGLSKQINTVDDKDISSELRIKLLYNILEVNSENPGKLISDYNKSDHPLMDALEKSVKLSNAVKKLDRIPGMSRVAQFFARKSDEILEDQAKKAEAGLNQIIGSAPTK
jgi:hypothetical protein